jgi:hypothetical protein
VWFLLPYLDRWYLTLPVGREEATAAGISCIYKVEFTYKCTKDGVGECV